MNLSEYLGRYDCKGSAGNPAEALTDHDLASLSDWASDMNRCNANYNWKRAYSLIREGADLLLRRRARSPMSAVETVKDNGVNTVTLYTGAYDSGQATAPHALGSSLLGNPLSTSASEVSK